MKVREKKRVAVVLLLLGMMWAMVTGCGTVDDEEDGLVSLTALEETQDEANLGVPTSQDAKGQDAKGQGGVTAGGSVSKDGAADSDGSTAGGIGGTETDVGNQQEDVVYVYVCGSVNCPGVYKLKPEARIYEAIEAAGGLSEDAAAEYVNQARKVEDGLKIYVPGREEAERGMEVDPGTSLETGQTGTTSAKVNINSATVEELKTLPGIGDAKAQSIVSYRQTNGMFQSIEDLMNVEGIKSGVFDKIKDKIVV